MFRWLQKKQLCKEKRTVCLSFLLGVKNTLIACNIQIVICTAQKHKLFIN